MLLLLRDDVEFEALLLLEELPLLRDDVELFLEEVSLLRDVCVFTVPLLLTRLVVVWRVVAD